MHVRRMKIVRFKRRKKSTYIYICIIVADRFSDGKSAQQLFSVLHARTSEINFNCGQIIIAYTYAAIKTDDKIIHIHNILYVLTEKH